jgi:hypothetical protein
VSRSQPLDLRSGDGAVESETVHRAVPSVQYLPVEFDGRRVGHLTVDTPGERDEWEVHPDQDEFA